VSQGKRPPGKKSPWQKTHPRDKNPPAPDTQQATTYSIAAVAGNWTILVSYWFSHHDGKTNTELITEHIFVMAAMYVYTYRLIC